MQGVEGSPSAAVPAAPEGARLGRDVVILREGEVEDIPSAIRRLRQDAATARSQILIIAAEPESASLPPQEVEPRNAPVTARARVAAHTEGTSALARSLAPLVADLGQLFSEVQREVAGLAEDVGEGTRARLQHRARVLGEIVTWTQAVTGDLDAILRAALEGRRPADLAELWQEAVLGADAGDVQFLLEPPPAATVHPELDAMATLDLLAACARLAAARIGMSGTVRASFARDAAAVTLMLQGMGAARPVRAPELAREVRAAAAALGIGVSAGVLGTKHGTTLALTFPLPRT